MGAPSTVAAADGHEHEWQWHLVAPTRKLPSNPPSVASSSKHPPLPAPPPSAPRLDAQEAHSLEVDCARTIHGHHLDVLVAPPSLALLRPFATSLGEVLGRQASTQHQPQSDLQSHIDSLVARLGPLCHQHMAAATHHDDTKAQLHVLCIVAACLHTFLQLNYTGPDPPHDLTPYEVLRRAAPNAFPPRTVAGGSSGGGGGGRSIGAQGDDDAPLRVDDALNRAAIDQLTLSGEPAYHLCRHPFWLLLARRLVDGLAHLVLDERQRSSPRTAAAAAAAAAAGQQASPPPSGRRRPLASVAWWQLRAATLHSRVLDEFVPLPASLLARFDATTLSQLERLAESERAESAPPSFWSALHAQALVERGLAVQRAGQDRDASELFASAARANGLRYELTGALGKRTKFQAEEKVQLVLLAESASEVDAGDRRGGGHARKEEDEARRRDQRSASDEAQRAPRDRTDGTTPHADRSGWKASRVEGLPSNVPATFALNDEVLLERTRFTSTVAPPTPTAASEAANASPLAHLDPNEPPRLTPLDTCVLLALSLNLRNASPENGLTSSQVSAFVSRGLCHATNWSVYTVALLLRSRLEAKRTRTAERAVLQLQALLDQMPTSDSTLLERLAYVWSVDLPATWELQAELARLYAALGVLRSALETFERVQMWEEVVQCLGAMGRQEEAVAVVRELLEGTRTEATHVALERKRDEAAPRGEVRARLNAARRAKLWCLLGDLEVDSAESHYLVAWDVSGHASARAARSLGALHFARAEYPTAVRWLRRALRIGALHVRSWFLLGCAYMRLERWEGATRSFRRCTSLDDEDGESWNNLASCYLRLGQRGERARGVVEPPSDDAGEDAIQRADEEAVLGRRRAARPEAEEARLRGESVVGRDDDDDDDDDDDASSQASSSVASTKADSGVAVSEGTAASDADSDADTVGHDDGGGGGGGVGVNGVRGSTPYELKLLAHRALSRSLRFSHDSWRVWSNYAVVSVDAGLLAEAARGLAKVVELRTSSSSSQQGGRMRAEDVVDLDVLDRLVDGVTRRGASPADVEAEAREAATAEEAESADARDGASGSRSGHAQRRRRERRRALLRQHNPHEGVGLAGGVLRLLRRTLLARFESSEAVWRAYARVQLWRNDYRGCLESELRAWQCSEWVAGGKDDDDDDDATSSAAAATVSGEGSAEAASASRRFVRGVERLKELCELLENLGPKPQPRRLLPLDDEEEEEEQAEERDADEADTADAGGATSTALPNWRFRARSAVRAFLGRHREWGEEGGWSEQRGGVGAAWTSLLELRDGLSTAKAT